MNKTRYRTLLRAGIVIAILVALSGCETLDRWRDSLRNQASQTYENINNQVERAGEQMERTRQAIDQKVQDVRDAADKIKDAGNQVGEAVDAVRRVTGGGTTSAGSAAGTDSPQ